MGHNFVVGKTADVAMINADGMKAGAAAGGVKAGNARIVAAGMPIGGGASTAVNIAVPML